MRRSPPRRNRSAVFFVHTILQSTLGATAEQSRRLGETLLIHLKIRQLIGNIVGKVSVCGEPTWVDTTYKTTSSLRVED